MVVSGNTVARQVLLTGTHKGALQTPNRTVPATNRRVELHVAAFGRFDGSGKLVEDRRYFDTADLVRQLGLAARSEVGNGHDGKSNGAAAAARETIGKFVESINRGDSAAVSTLYAPDAALIDPMGTFKGRDAIRKVFDSFFKAFPDLHVTQQRLLAKGNTAIGEFVVTGTHKGPIPGPQGDIPPTNRRAEIRESHVARLNDQGLIVEDRVYFDLPAFMRQLGLM